MQHSGASGSKHIDMSETLQLCCCDGAEPVWTRIWWILIVDLIARQLIPAFVYTPIRHNIMTPDS